MNKCMFGSYLQINSVMFLTNMKIKLLPFFVLGQLISTTFTSGELNDETEVIEIYTYNNANCEDADYKGIILLSQVYLENVY